MTASGGLFRRLLPRLWIAVLTLALVGIVFYSSLIGRTMAVQYAPLIEAATEIKLEATLGHLWFEKAISSDRSIDIEEVWAHLD